MGKITQEKADKLRVDSTTEIADLEANLKQWKEEMLALQDKIMDGTLKHRKLKANIEVVTELEK